MKRVLITGANRGIGLEFVRQCLDRGDRVFAACRNPAGASQLHALAAAAQQQLTLMPLDLSNDASIAAAARLVAEYTPALDLLVNNAAILGKARAIDAIDPADMLAVLRVNAVGPLLLIHHCRHLLLAGEAPQIANISSESGCITAQGGFRQSAYTYGGSKTLLNMYTRILAHDPHLRGVAAYAIHPGWVQTDMGGMDATLTPRQSVRSMLKAIAGFKQDDSGKFFNWQGKRLPW